MRRVLTKQGLPMKCLILIMSVLTSTLVFAEAKKVAIVKLLRGEVDMISLGKTTRLKVDDWVEDGSQVKTAEKSFVKLSFTDKSQMNIGPNSEMKIVKFSGNDSGVIDLVKGQIRSQVTKDYLQKDKSKLFIKTPNAVMGIRGTDFSITSNGKTTTAILFEGSVVFNKIDASSAGSDTSRLEAMVNEGVRIQPGEFSVVDPARSMPTIPSRLNLEQFEALEKNDTFESRAPSSSGSEEVKKTVVPAGLSGAIVSNDSETLKSEVAQLGGTQAPEASSKTNDANGFVNGDAVKPANGSFVHLESGVIIPPGSDSVLDPNTNSYIPGPNSGKISADGSYLPPANVEITGDGKILVVTTGNNGQKQVEEKPAPSVVKMEAPKTVAPVPAMGANASANQAVRAPSAKVDPFNPGGMSPVIRNAPTGGVPDVNQAVQQFAPPAGAVLRTIRVQD